MSVAKAYNMWCDECGEGEAFDSDTWPAWQTIAEIRKAGRRRGWTHTRDGRDLCPEHSGGEES